MLIKCICKSCAGHLEFEEENAGQIIKCPHCGFYTTLYVPGAERVQEELVTLNRKLRSQKLALISGAGVLGLGGIVWCLYHWGMPLVQDQFPSVESPVLRVLLLLGLCLGVTLLLIWLLLPIVAFFEWRRFLRLLAQVEQHLAANRSQTLPEITEETEHTEHDVATKA
jgi:hypothetical protein